MFDGCPVAKGVFIARVLAAAPLAGLGEFLKLLFLLNCLWSYLTPPVLTTYTTSFKYLYMERTVLDAIHTATASIEYLVSYVLSMHNLITSGVGITEGSLWDAPPTLIINTFKYTNQM